MGGTVGTDLEISFYIYMAIKKGTFGIPNVPCYILRMELKGPSPESNPESKSVPKISKKLFMIEIFSCSFQFPCHLPK